jgi:hypothetical protein
VKALPPKARASVGMAATYWCGCGHVHRETGSAANARTIVLIAGPSSAAVMVLTVGVFKRSPSLFAIQDSSRSLCFPGTLFGKCGIGTRRADAHALRGTPCRCVAKSDPASRSDGC